MNKETNFNNCADPPFGLLDETEYTWEEEEIPCHCCNSNKVCNAATNNHICISENSYNQRKECKSSGCTNRKCTCSTDPQKCGGRCGNFHDCICNSSLLHSCKSKIHVCICAINVTKQCKSKGPHKCSCDASCNITIAAIAANAIIDTKIFPDVISSIINKYFNMSCSCKCIQSTCNPCLCDTDVFKCRNLYTNCICTCAFSSYFCRASYSHECVCSLSNNCIKCGRLYLRHYTEEQEEKKKEQATKKQEDFNMYRTTFEQNKEKEKKNYMCSGNISDIEKKKENYIICKKCKHVASSKGNGNCQCCNTQWRIDNSIFPHFCRVKFVLQTQDLQTKENKSFSYKEFKS